MSLITSILTGGVNNHETTAEEANALATDFISEGIVGAIANTSGVAPATGGFAVNATGTPDTNIQISAGTAYVTATPSTQGSQTIRVKNSATITQAISANSSGSTKYDWVYLSVDATNANAPNTAGDNVASITVSRSSSAASDDGTPPTYAILLAVVTVANGFSTITNSTIRDRRSQCTLGATSDSPDSFWTTGGLPAVSSVTENGNRSANITFASTVASILTPGMRIRTSRTVAAPTYMGGLFNGTNQYFTKVTCTSTLSTVTDNFTIVANILPTTYPVARAYICGRSDATPNNGFGIFIEPSGQIGVIVFNAATANLRSVLSYQSISVLKRQNIAVTWAAGVVTMYLDGVSIPVTTATTGGTAPTVAGTGGDWSIGRFGAFGAYSSGYISGVGVFNAVLSASTIRSYKNQVLSGSETNCIGAWSLNNTAVNQQAAGTNDLTATNAVSYSSGVSPYCTDANGVAAGTYDWAIVTRTSPSTPTVATVQYPEGCAIPTSGGISTVDYSGVKAPFGMPVAKNRWRLSSLLRTASATTSNATYGAFLAGGWALNAQVGEWELGWRAGYVDNAVTTAVTFNISSTALTGLTLAAGNNASPYAMAIQSSAAALTSIPMYSMQPQSLTAAVTYTMYSIGATTNCGIEGTQGTAEIFADLAYL